MQCRGTDAVRRTGCDTEERGWLWCKGMDPSQGLDPLQGLELLQGDGSVQGCTRWWLCPPRRPHPFLTAPPPSASPPGGSGSVLTSPSAPPAAQRGGGRPALPQRPGGRGDSTTPPPQASDNLPLPASSGAQRYLQPPAGNPGGHPSPTAHPFGGGTPPCSPHPPPAAFSIHPRAGTLRIAPPGGAAPQPGGGFAGAAAAPDGEAALSASLMERSGGSSRSGGGGRGVQHHCGSCGKPERGRPCPVRPRVCVQLPSTLHVVVQGGVRA